MNKTKTKEIAKNILAIVIFIALVFLSGFCNDDGRFAELENLPPCGTVYKVNCVNH